MCSGGFDCCGSAGEAEKTDDEEEEEEKEQIAGLNIDVHADSALQLTVTRTSLSIFSELVQVSAAS